MRKEDEAGYRMITYPLKFKTAKLIYVGSVSNFVFKPFIKQCRGKSPTICIVKTAKGRIFGMFTDIKWSDNGKHRHNQGNSFIFKFDENSSQITKYRNKKAMRVEESEIYL